MKVYLAGKISKNGWRNELGCNASVYAGGKMGEWGVEEISPNIFCTGPWFVSCDHGCFHGDKMHGVGLPVLTENACTSEPSLSRSKVVQLCLKAIDDCDFVFCWLDEPGAYGTMFEIGYAIGKGKKVYVSGPVFSKGPPNYDEGDPPEEWFASEACTFMRGDWEGALKENFELACKTELLQARVKKIIFGSGSPIEAKLCRHMLPDLYKNGVSVDNIHAQYQVKNYRLDFAVLHNGKKICIEADGHEFHEKTKEQAMHDRERDRVLQLDGWMVLRFTGSEIHNNGAKCAKQILLAVTGKDLP